jgi:hypothetical protein
VILTGSRRNCGDGLAFAKNYELINERDFSRLPLRDRRIIQRAGWIVALAIVFACIVAGYFG